VSRSIGSFRIDDMSRLASKSIRVAENAEDLWKIGELRYSLYVERDKKAYPGADRTNRCFIEAIDYKSLNIFGISDGDCLTATRITRANLATEDPYLRRLLAHSPINAVPVDRIAVVSRLVAAEHPRSRPLLTSALREAYRVGLRNGINFAVAATRPSLVHFFERFGWAASGRAYTEEIAGEMRVVALKLRDRAHLQSSNAILLDLLDEFEREEIVEASA
jgi:hypothetical protein